VRPSASALSARVTPTSGPCSDEAIKELNEIL
jgi:hypothetical protein